MFEYTKIKTARTIICELCNELYPDDPCEPADCDWLRMLEEDAVSVPQWIIVKDRLPKYENPVLAGNAGTALPMGVRHCGGGWEYCSGQCTACTKLQSHHTSTTGGTVKNG